MSEKLVTVVYEPKNQKGRAQNRKVLFGKYIFPGESRQVTEKQAKMLEKDKDFRIIRAKAASKPTGQEPLPEMPAE